MSNMTRTKIKYVHDKPLDTIYYEHSSHSGALLEGLNTLRERGELFDITLVIEGSAFRAHKAVLAGCSNYFRAMFTDNMLESRQKEIRLNGITAKGFSQILEYAYTSRLGLNLANVQDVLEAACYIQMDKCIQACANYLQSQIDMDTCVDIATIAEIYSLLPLKLKVYRYMSGRLLEFSNSSEFYRLSPVQLENLLSCDFPVDCSEADVLRIVLAWFFHVDVHELPMRIAYAVKIIKHINFKEISKRKLDSILDKVFEDRNYDWQMLYRIIIHEVYIQSSSNNPRNINLDLLNSRGMEMALLKIGGFGVNGMTNEITYCFLTDKKWRHLTSIPHIEQCNYGAAVLNNELYIVGGCYNQSLEENIHPFGFKYSPTYNKWSTLLPMKTERCRFSLNVVGDMLYATGGESEGEEFVISTCECYNPKSDRWSVMPQMPVNVTQHAGASYETELGCCLYISGGMDKDACCNSNMLCYVVSAAKWKVCTPMLSRRADHVMLNVGKYLYVCGGWIDDRELRTRTLVDTIDVYDTENDCWETVTKVPTPRFHAGIACVDEKIYFVGGFHSDVFDKDTAAIEYYDINTNSWTVEEKYPQDIWEHTCVTLYIPKFRDDMEVIKTSESSV